MSISAVNLDIKSNYQYFQRYPETDISIAADAEATLPYLIEACRRCYGRSPARDGGAGQETRRRPRAGHGAGPHRCHLCMGCVSDQPRAPVG